jgi:hypothetical protein
MNPRIPEIVKNLANLVQDLENAQENRESLEVLGRIKLYSAQLYLESDMEIIALNRDDLEELVDFEDEEFSTTELDEFENDSPEKQKMISDDNEFNVSAEEEIEVEFYPLEEPISEEFEIDMLSGKHEDSFFNHSENSLNMEPHDSIVLEEKTVENITENEEESLDEVLEEKEMEDESEINVEPEIENTFINDLHKSPNEVPKQPELFSNIGDLDAYKIRAQEILGMFSLSRRFEFANLLFAGDMQQFTVFLCEVLAAPNSDAREDVIDKWYENNQWRRKDETASDLKRNLRKML